MKKLWQLLVNLSKKNKEIKIYKDIENNISILNQENYNVIMVPREIFMELNKLRLIWIVAYNDKNLYLIPAIRNSILRTIKKTNENIEHFKIDSIKRVQISEDNKVIKLSFKNKNENKIFNLYSMSFLKKEEVKKFISFFKSIKNK